MKEGKGRDGWRISSQITWDIICLNELGWLSICVVIVRMEEDRGRGKARVEFYDFYCPDIATVPDRMMTGQGK